MATQSCFWGSAPDLGNSSITDEVDFGSTTDVEEPTTALFEHDVPSDDVPRVYPTDSSAL